VLSHGNRHYRVVTRDRVFAQRTSCIYTSSFVYLHRNYRVFTRKAFPISSLGQYLRPSQNPCNTYLTYFLTYITQQSPVDNVNHNRKSRFARHTEQPKRAAKLIWKGEMICASPPEPPLARLKDERGSRRRVNHMGESTASRCGSARKELRGGEARKYSAQKQECGLSPRAISIRPGGKAGGNSAVVAPVASMSAFQSAPGGEAGGNRPNRARRPRICVSIRPRW
jgi:hypothetical protein